MPLLFKRSGNHFEWAVWHITEQESYFESHLTAPENIPNPKVRLQWYATRHLINELTGAPCVILKDEYGKPYLQNSTGHISLSHTVNYAAAIVSKNSETGIDIEAVHPRVERIAHKFLRADELQAIAPEERTAKLMLLWSAKEALYKMHGRKQLDFTTQLLIAPSTMQTAGQLQATVVAGEPPQPATVYYEFFEGQVVAYVIGQ
jgi:phosphopantetheinyl transferase